MESNDVAKKEIPKTMLAPNWKDTRAEREAFVRAQIKMLDKYKVVRDPLTPCLSAPNKEIQDPSAWVEEAQTLLGHMLIENGVGMAAPQIGLNIQMVIVKPPDFPTALVFFNPRLVDAPEEYFNGKEMVSNMKWGVEGCVSHPGLWCEVARANKIKFWAKTFQYPKGTMFEAEGMLSQILQHEIHHCLPEGGRLITDLGIFVRNFTIDRVGQEILFEGNRHAAEFGRPEAEV